MSKQILKDGIVSEDDWHFLADDETQLEKYDAIVFPLSRWIDERASCLAFNGRKGVVTSNTDDVSLLADDIDKLDLICIDFPNAVDGRGYSQAHLLRERFAYDKELRAIGDVLVDQLFLLVRCGMNAFDLREDQDVAKASKFLSPFSVTYQ
ncbi:MAG: DUF934 domain-containing protein [Pseudomonadales bacterium]